MKVIKVKRLLITHIADPDGAGPIILSRYVFDDMDFISIDVDEVDKTLKDNLDNYDFIYVTDLNISDELASLIDKSKYKDKIKIFDHHASNIHKNKYSFITVIDEVDGYKECGTTLYYKYLLDNYDNVYLHKDSLEHLVELTRQGDTWNFNHLKEDALNLSALYAIYGRDTYIDKYYNMILENDKFLFTELDKQLLEIEKNNKKSYIENKMKGLIETKIDNYRVGIVFAEKYRSSLGHKIAESYDVGIVINLDHGVSYRADSNNDIDVSLLAKKYGGGGHIKACGSSIPKNLKEKIISYIFDIEMEGSNDSN